jgi:hypothetical protein
MLASRQDTRVDQTVVMMVLFGGRSHLLCNNDQSEYSSNR